MMMNWLRVNILAVVAAIAVGMLSAAPSVLAMADLGSEYKGMPFYYADDEYTYTSWMQEIVDGHWLAGSAFLYEYKQTFPVIPPLAEYVYALPTILFGIPLIYVVMFFRFLLPALLFLLVYGLFIRMAGDSSAETKARRISGMAAGFLATFVYDQACLSVIWNYRQAFFGSMWTRTVNPIMGALMFFAFLNFFWSYLKNGKRSHGLLAGLFLAVSFFYFFSWGMIVSCVVFAALLAAIQKDWLGLRKIAFLSGVGILGSLPWLAMVLLALNQGGEGSAGKNGMFFTHVPTVNYFVYAAVAVFAALSFYAWRFGKRMLRAEDWWSFAVALVLASLWVYCQQLVTGMALWPYHFVQYTRPLMMFVVLLTGYKILQPSFPRVWNTFAILICVVGLACGTAMAASYRNVMADYRSIQSKAEVMSWLNKNAPRDCVVLYKGKDDTILSQITALSHCNVYISFWNFYGIPMERNLHNFYVDLRLKGITPETAKEYLQSHRGDIRRVYYTNFDQLRVDREDVWFAQKLEEAVNGYADFYAQNFTASLRKYRLDYILADEELTGAELELMGLNASPVQIGGRYIYKVD